MIDGSQAVGSRTLEDRMRVSTRRREAPLRQLRTTPMSSDRSYSSMTGPAASVQCTAGGAVLLDVE